MSECEALTFNSLTPEKWQFLQKKAADNNIAVSGDSGEASQHGFTFRWQYDPSQSVLTIQCLDHPFWAPCALINEKISQLAAEHLQL